MRDAHNAIIREGRELDQFVFSDASFEDVKRALKKGWFSRDKYINEIPEKDWLENFSGVDMDDICKTPRGEIYNVSYFKFFAEKPYLS